MKIANRNMTRHPSEDSGTQSRQKPLLQISSTEGGSTRLAPRTHSVKVYLVYAAVALLVGIVSSIFLWWSARPQFPYEPEGSLLFIQVMKHAPEALTSRAPYLNGIVLALIYLLCVTLVNRFWAGTAIFATFVTVYGVATKIKITMRDEPIIPSDLDFLTGKGGGAGAVTSFVTSDSRKLITSSIIYLIFSILLCVGLQIIDKTPFIQCSWRHPLKRQSNIWALIARILAPFICVALLASYGSEICQPHSLIYRTLHSIGYKPMLWSTRTDAQHNGSLNTFLSLTHVDAMQTEPDYSPAAMQIIYDRYAKAANSINAKRTQNLTDSTVVMVLSESFSDPNRVPGVHFNKDPMPNIRKLDSTTTSGLMLSPGYGGGTANIEFQQLTGLTMANYNASLLTPYQQLLPQRSQFYSFNTIWNASCGKAYSTNCSIGYHPYHQSFYMRQANYKKMGFSHFYALDSDPAIPHGKQYVGTNGEQGYVSDSDAYQNVIDSIRANTKEHKPSQYIQLITMQNHAPYTDLYGPTNEFRQTNASAHMPDEERDSIANYAKGVQRTDIATSDFLSALDSIDQPWYSMETTYPASITQPARTMRICWLFMRPTISSGPIKPHSPTTASSRNPMQRSPLQIISWHRQPNLWTPKSLPTLRSSRNFTMRYQPCPDPPHMWTQRMKRTASSTSIAKEERLILIHCPHTHNSCLPTIEWCSTTCRLVRIIS